MLYSSNTTYAPHSYAAPPSNPSLSDSSYSSTLLDHAERLYRVANDTELKSFADSVPDVTSSYGSSGYGDDLAVAALTLAIATNNSAYYLDAYNAYTKYRLTGTSFVYNWDSRTPGLFVLFAEASMARPGLAEGAGLDRNVSGWQAEAENYFDRVINSQTSNTRLTSGEFVVRTPRRGSEAGQGGS
jgi:endoglucanase